MNYAIKRDGEVIILIEAKCAGTCLDSGKVDKDFMESPKVDVKVLEIL